MNEQKNDNLLRWHQRYGHLNITDLKKMENKNIVRGLNLNFPVNTLRKLEGVQTLETGNPKNYKVSRFQIF